jgi:transposase
MSWLDELRTVRPDVAALMDQGLEAVVRRLLEVERERDAARAATARSPIGDSRTTHAPPSTDPRPKPRSQRRKTGKKTGGQPGHAGHRLEPVATPDHIVTHVVTTCAGCGHDLTTTTAATFTPHQVFELPRMPLVVTEHRLERKVCPCCAATTTAAPPAGAEQPTQYGPRLAGLAVYLHVGHFVPLERTADIIEVLTGRRVSEGWISACQERVSGRLDPFIAAVTASLRAAKAICCDETGFRFAGRRFWLHVCCTALLTLLLCHRRRGADGTNALGVLPGYTGTAIHDHWSPYFTCDTCTHAVCNEHHVRELDGVTERDGQVWAERMKVVLYDGLDLKRRYHDNGQDIPTDDIAALTARYEQCLRDGYAVTPEPSPAPPPGPKRGRPKRGKTLSLLDRLRDRQVETLRFLHERQVPWSNNQAERDIRPMKIQQKVSGGFRTEAGAIEFCRIRSYLSTTAKNGIDPCEATALALTGRPWLPTGQMSMPVSMMSEA